MTKYRIREICALNKTSLKKNDLLQEIIYLDTSNITENKIDNLQLFSISEAPSRAQRKVQNNTILFSTVRPNQNHFGILKNPQENLIVSSGFTTLDVIDENQIDSSYLYFKLTQPFVVNYLQTVAQNSVSAYPSINPDDIGNLLFEFPELDYQRKIAAVLSSLDDKIALNNRINAKLESMAKRLYDYWFVQFDFPNEDGKPYKSSGGKMVWSEELKRKIPAGWEVVKFKDVITHINTGLNPRDNFTLGSGKIRYITVKNLTEEGEINFSNCDLIDEDARELVHNRSEIEKGDILFASICPLGRCYLIASEPETWDINESVFSIRPNYFNITSGFLYAVLRDPYYVKKMTQKATGSIFKGIRIDDIEKIGMLLPKINIINLFTEKISSLLAKQSQLQEENLKLSAMRDYLLPLLMNGQISVN